MPVPEFPDDIDDEPINIPQETIQMVLESLQTPPSVTRRSTEEAATTGEPPATPIVRPASSNTAEDSDDTGTSFERTVVGVQRELAKEVRVGMQTMAASLEGVRSCMMSSADQAAAMQTRTSLLQELVKTQKEICTAVIQLTQQLQLQSSQRVHECNIEPLRADLAAYHRDVAAILKNQQALLAAVLPFITLQGAAPGMSSTFFTNLSIFSVNDRKAAGSTRGSELVCVPAEVEVVAGVGWVRDCPAITTRLGPGLEEEAGSIVADVAGATWGDLVDVVLVVVGGNVGGACGVAHHAPEARSECYLRAILRYPHCTCRMCLYLMARRSKWW
ncbi:hypothetical protein NDU88_007589 [Pleurodeles waltl]|uniref:Uncharacterized protein n=1 Tax=Pleurodeles waltl TaxID=8319 RepID=A0AAV7U1Y4_PLEWA|nr:hypothetical protein NDU88_007589 [Pleurodeles waltl]